MKSLAPCARNVEDDEHVSLALIYAHGNETRLRTARAGAKNERALAKDLLDFIERHPVFLAFVAVPLVPLEPRHSPNAPRRANR